MNWGNGIVVVFIVFVALMATMVTICMKQDDLHLVTDNYYEEEIRYQEHIDKVSNSFESERKALRFDARKKVLTLNLPIGAQGELHLFRPSDARMDRKIDVDITEKDVNTVSLNDLESGYWRVKLTWKENGKGFFEEKKIDL